MPVQYHYGKFPPDNLNWEALSKPLVEAAGALAAYNTFLELIPNSDILVSPMMQQEAVASNKIEGTQATVGEVFEYQAGNTDVSASLESDIIEVINYRLALDKAADMLSELPLSGRVLKEAHRVLLNGVRGKLKSPGMYRIEDNWIGSPGSKIEEAKFVPIKLDLLDYAMFNWETYVNDEEITPLIKIAVSHAEFESIHPFYDGNGRIGRMLIPIMLWNEGLLSHPCFYLSSFFDRRNDEYRDKLLCVSRDNAWTEWCLFFLEAIKTQAIDNHVKAKEIFSLNREIKKQLSAETASSGVYPVVDKLFFSPIFSVSEFIKIDDVDAQVARRLLHTLESMGHLVVIRKGSGRRSAMMAFPKLFEITEGLSFS